MDQKPHQDDGARLRLLEGWIPLVQALNDECGWGLDARAVEQLVLAAAPAFACVTSLAEARAVVYHQHIILHGAER